MGDLLVGDLSPVLDTAVRELSKQKESEPVRGGAGVDAFRDGGKHEWRTLRKRLGAAAGRPVDENFLGRLPN